MSHPFEPHGPRAPAPDDERDQAVITTILAALEDIRRCLGDGVRRGVDPRMVLFVVGAPRVVACTVPGVEVCDCQVLAVGVERALYITGLRRAGREALADDLDAPLAPGELRLLVFTPGTASAATIKAPPTDFTTAHACTATGGAA